MWPRLGQASHGEACPLPEVQDAVLGNPRGQAQTWETGSEEGQNPKMKILAGVLLAVVPALAQQTPLRLYSNDIGPIAVSSEITPDGDWAATFRNESGVTLRQACLCIRSWKGKTGCDVILRCSAQRLAPGESASFAATVPVRGRGLPKHRVVLLNVFQANKLDPVLKIYVERLSGGNGEMAREQIMAAVANTNGRFQLTEDRAEADATLVGRDEIRDSGELQSSGARISGLGVATTGAGVAVMGGNSRTVAGSKTEILTRENLVLRLVLPSGDTVWAWDDQPICAENTPKAKCAVTDLLSAALK